MTTTTGLLSKGDHLSHPDMPDITFVVTERTGNNKGDYGVWIKRHDNKRMAGFRRDRTRNNDHEYLMLEAHYHVFISRGGWSLLTEKDELRDQLEHTTGCDHVTRIERVAG
jgi:hypothetical protein